VDGDGNADRWDRRFRLRSRNSFKAKRAMTPRKQAHAERVLAHLEKQAETQVHGDVIEALTQALEYFEDRADVVDGSYGEPSPNREMSLAQLCQDALARVALKVTP
jgi:hypothetical protein